MKKILFNDKFGLTQAVLEGRKTQTRRIIRGVYSVSCSGIDMLQTHKPAYKLGEVIAIAQSYKDAGIEDVTDKDGFLYHAFTIAGWNNKMFVRPDLMPHQIHITNVRIERLQDISDEDCLKEGLEWDGIAYKYNIGYSKETGNKTFLGKTPREAFAHLIDKVSGKGTWDSNPYVWVYDFELIK
ncbi:MAG TPA: hypothetical protein H9824_05685 [Candidatus Bacteroides pullicola]|uniref:ASCH domain-containing protein n=1 Tax=Candidatus Bacteroides pullicola TaxID=2838475 RepID=A0A9D2CKN3_9BACE|nr:hypothetical protein [Candidatus Bacteroides pullicola]